MNQDVEVALLRSADWQPLLIGDRLKLRPLAENDYQSLFAVARDPNIWQGYCVPGPSQPQSFRIFFERIMAEQGAVVVVARASDAIVGCSSFINHVPEQRVVEIGNTFLATRYWGGSFNRELKLLMLSHAFALVERVEFRICATNVRCRRACEKIGGRLSERAQYLSEASSSAPALVYEISRVDFNPQLFEMID